LSIGSFFDTYPTLAQTDRPMVALPECYKKCCFARTLLLVQPGL